MSVKAALVWCPFPNRAVARQISQQLIDEKLAACANILGEMESIFEWNGERGEDVEVPVLFKCNTNVLDALTKRLGELHPYDTPAILGWHCDAGHPSTLAWLGDLGSGDAA